MTKKRQIEYWDEISEDIEKSMKNNDTATSFSIIKRLRGESKQPENLTYTR